VHPAAWRAGPQKLRIIQTNSAGDNVISSIPPPTRWWASSKASRSTTEPLSRQTAAVLYISNEADNTLDYVDAKTLKVTDRVG
jgi:hypothetical protein